MKELTKKEIMTVETILSNYKLDFKYEYSEYSKLTGISYIDNLCQFETEKALLPFPKLWEKVKNLYPYWGRAYKINDNYSDIRKFTSIMTPKKKQAIKDCLISQYEVIEKRDKFICRYKDISVLIPKIDELTRKYTDGIQCIPKPYCCIYEDAEQGIKQYQVFKFLAGGDKFKATFWVEQFSQDDYEKVLPIREELVENKVWWYTSDWMGTLCILPKYSYSNLTKLLSPGNWQMYLGFK